MRIIENKTQWEEMVGHILTFKYLNKQELAIILKAGSVITYDTDEVLAKEGELEPWFFGILEGTVSVSVSEKNKKETYMNSLGPGDIFGEAGIFLNVPRTATITAMGPCTVFRIHRNDLSAFFKQNPVATNKMLLVIIYGLLRKLRAANLELAFERREDIDQSDIDAMVDRILNN